MSKSSDSVLNTVTSTPEEQPLLEAIERARPGTEIKILEVADSFVLGLQQGSETMWVPLDTCPASFSPEALLEQLAGMLVFCANCATEQQSHCHSPRRFIAAKLRGFLGEAGFQRFFRNASERGHDRNVVSPML